VLDQRGRLLVAALGFAGCSMPSYDRALHALRSWVDSWSGIGHVAVGMAPGLRPSAHEVRRAWMAGDALHDGDGVFADERHWHRMGAHAVAGDAAGGVGGVEEG
jgi:hypothetical protein